MSKCEKTGFEFESEERDTSGVCSGNNRVITEVSVHMCVCVLADHHQSAAAVLRPAGQELPLLLREGEDSEYRYLHLHRLLGAPPCAGVFMPFLSFPVYCCISCRC